MRGRQPIRRELQGEAAVHRAIGAGMRSLLLGRRVGPSRVVADGQPREVEGQVEADDQRPCGVGLAQEDPADEGLGGHQVEAV